MMDNRLSASKLYYSNDSPVQWGSFTQIKKYIREKSTSKKEADNNIKTLDELRKEINLGTHSFQKIAKIGQYHYHISPYKHALYQADLMDILGGNKNNFNYKKINDGFIWLLLVINCQTKMLYFRMQKTKTAAETTKALLSIFTDDIKVKKPDDHEISLQVDQGSEFINKLTQKTLKPYNIHMYSSYSRMKASIVERSIRTIRPRLTRAMETRGGKWISLISDIIGKYNNTFHTSISMTPHYADKHFTETLFKLQEHREKVQQKLKKYSHRFKVNDIVRVRVHWPRTPFKKGSHRIFSAEVFTIESVQKRMDHATYKLCNDKGEIMGGTYNDNDLLLGKRQEIYNIIVLDKRKKGKISEVLIQYDGFADTPPKWINEKDLIIL